MREPRTLKRYMQCNALATELRLRGAAALVHHSSVIGTVGLINLKA